MNFWQEWHRVMLCPFQLIIPVGYDINMLLNFIIWLRWCMPGFSAIKLLCFVLIINKCLIGRGYFETRQIPCFSLHLHLLILTSFGDSCWKSLFLCYLTSSDLLFPSILMFINCHFTIRRSWSVSVFYSTIFLCHWISWILILFHGLESVIIIIHFYCSNSLDLGFENSFKLAHVSFWHTLITLWALFYLMVQQDIPNSSLFSLPQAFQSTFPSQVLFIG